MAAKRQPSDRRYRAATDRPHICQPGWRDGVHRPSRLTHLVRRGLATTANVVAGEPRAVPRSGVGKHAVELEARPCAMMAKAKPASCGGCCYLWEGCSWRFIALAGFVPRRRVSTLQDGHKPLDVMSPVLITQLHCLQASKRGQGFGEGRGSTAGGPDRGTVIPARDPRRHRVLTTDNASLSDVRRTWTESRRPLRIATCCCPLPVAGAKQTRRR